MRMRMMIIILYILMIIIRQLFLQLHTQWSGINYIYYNDEDEEKDLLL